MPGLDPGVHQSSPKNASKGGSSTASRANRNSSRAASRERGKRGRVRLDGAPETRMTIADMVYNQVKLLPEPLAREVLDFVGFLREGRDRAEWRDLMNAQETALAAVWDNPEDKVWDDV